jgi:hypothetical protein
MATTLVIEEQIEIPLDIRSLADFRRQPLVFGIHECGPSQYRAVKPDPEGFQFSAVLGCHFRLESRRDAQGHQVFDLRQKQ